MVWLTKRKCASQTALPQHEPYHITNFILLTRWYKILLFAKSLTISPKFSNVLERFLTAYDTGNPRTTWVFVSHKAWARPDNVNRFGSSQSLVRSEKASRYKTEIKMFFCSAPSILSAARRKTYFELEIIIDISAADLVTLLNVQGNFVQNI